MDLVARQITGTKERRASYSPTGTAARECRLESRGERAEVEKAGCESLRLIGRSQGPAGGPRTNKYHSALSNFGLAHGPTS